MVATLILLALLVMAAVGGLGMLVLRPARGSSAPRCGRCNYNLTGSTGNRCPECGSLFIDVGVRVGQPDAVRRGRLLVFGIGCGALLIGGLLVTSLLTMRAAQMQRAAAQQAAAQARAAMVMQQAQQARAAQLSEQAAKAAERAYWAERKARMGGEQSVGHDAAPSGDDSPSEGTTAPPPDSP